MGNSGLAVAALLILGVVAQAGAVGEGVQVKEDGIIACPGTPSLRFLGSQFDVTNTGGDCLVNASTLVSLTGSCVGDTAADFCGDVDMTNSNVYADEIRGNNNVSGGNLQFRSTSHSTKGKFYLDSPIGKDATTGYSLHLDDRLLLADSNITSTAALFPLLNVSPSRTLTVASGHALTALRFAPTIDFANTPSSTGVGGGIAYAPALRATVNSENFGGAVGSGISAFTAQPGFQANTFTGITNWAYRSLYSNPFIGASGDSTGTMTMSRVTAVSSVGATLDDGVTITDWMGLHMQRPTVFSGSTITNITAVDIDDLATTGITNKYSLISKGSTTQMRHAGPVTIGANQAPTSGIELDVVGDLKASATVETPDVRGGTAADATLGLKATSNSDKGTVSVVGGFAASSAELITVTANDWTIQPSDDVALLTITAGAGYSIDCMAGRESTVPTDGQVMWLINITTSYNFTIESGQTCSDPAKPFGLGATKTLGTAGTRTAICVFYSTHWRCVFSG